jgi:hypothetical protein
MPKVRLDLEGGKLDKMKEEFPVRSVEGRVILALRHIEILNSLHLLDLSQLSMDRKLADLLAEVPQHLMLVPNGRARILRAIASWIEFHLSPSYVLFNLKALSIVTEKLLFAENPCSLGYLFRW